MEMNEESIFAAALELADPVDRAAFLDQVCAGNPALRKSVESLLSGYAIGSYLENQRFVLSPDQAPTVSYDSDQSTVGTTIDRYRLMELIGEGGMGLVFVAEQQKPVRRLVALKLIKPGMDTRQVIARFEVERQALALMDHPNIAKVLDAGTSPEGRPFFVMELVKGVPITEYCDAKAMTIRERLELFLQVCSAVQHAHLKGIIHRDLKPSNVLVAVQDVKPVVKVIDFGIAKSVGQQLTDMTVYTGFTQLVGTPLYMSPEQAGRSSLDIDTRTDLYSLGVLLYELLTGTTPIECETLRNAGPDELRRIIQEDDPAQPSVRLSTLKAGSVSTIADRRSVDPRQLSRTVRGELDWIVMKCLEKDRNRRYETVGSLGADLQRYLNDEPVMACPPSAGYRLRKFVRRNKAAVLTTVVVALAILLGTAMSVWKYLDERSARREADDNRVDAERNAREAKWQANEAIRAKDAAQKAQQESERQRDAVYQNLYVADIRLGLKDWQAGHVGRLALKLTEHKPLPGRKDLRGWEWYYLLGLCHQDEQTRFEHSASVRRVSWSRDGRYIASTGNDGLVIVWELASGKVVRQFGPGKTMTSAVAWSPTSQWLAWTTVADDNAIYLWNVGTRSIRTLRGHTNSVWAVAWHPDGQQLVSAGLDRTIRIWDLQSGECSRILNEANFTSTSVAWSSDGKWFASANHNTGVWIWDAATWQVVQKGLQGNRAVLVAWAPDGKQLAVGTTSGECFLYQVDGWTKVSEWSAHKGGVLGMVWGSDGRLATSGADNLIKIWKPNGTCESILRGHQSAVNSVAWESGERRLVSASMDQTVKVWSLNATSQPRKLSVRPGASLAMNWGTDGETLLALDYAHGVLTEWNAATGERQGDVSILKGSFGDIAPKSSLVALSDSKDKTHQLMVLNTTTRKVVRSWKTEFSAEVAFSPDHSRVAMAARLNLIVLDVATKKIIFHSKRGEFGPLAWSPDGRLLACAGGGDQSDGGYSRYASWVYVLDVSKGKFLLKLRHGKERALASGVSWSPDGKRLVSGDTTGLLEIWEIPTGRKLLSTRPHSSSITFLAWSPDGRRIASASHDETVRILDPQTGEELLQFDTPEGTVGRLRWSPDGKRLAAATNGTILIWDASPGFAYLQSKEYLWEQAEVQNWKASELSEQGKWTESLNAYTEVREQYTIAVGPDHPGPVRVINNMAVSLLNLGRTKDAIPLLEQALEKEKAFRHPDDPHYLAVVRNLAAAYDENGRHEAAEPVWQDVLDATRRAEDPKSLELAQQLAFYSMHLLAWKKYVEVEPILRECLTIREEKSPNDWRRFNTLHQVGGALLGQKKYAEAEPLLIQGYEGMKRLEKTIPSYGKMRLQEAIERLAHLYEATNQPQKAREWRAKLKPVTTGQ